MCSSGDLPNLSIFLPEWLLLNFGWPFPLPGVTYVCLCSSSRRSRFLHRDGGVLGEKSRFRALSVCTARSLRRNPGRCNADVQHVAQLLCWHRWALGSPGQGQQLDWMLLPAQGILIPLQGPFQPPQIRQVPLLWLGWRLGLQSEQGFLQQKVWAASLMCAGAPGGHVCVLRRRDSPRDVVTPGWHRGMWHTRPWSGLNPWV